MANTTYTLTDTKTHTVLATYNSRNRANNRADRLNNEHGSYRYTVQTIFDRTAK